MAKQRPTLANARAFLVALARDARANTLAIMTIALIPLAGMVGGGVDISRMYIVKTRLQHACDAGALAGRKSMGGGVWSFNSYASRTQAEKFFDANYNKNAYGVDSSTVTRTFTENAGKVSGTAQATLPMTLMRIFGKTTETLSVTCDAEMRLPNTDVMFVLDTTGSMGDKADSHDPTNKIDALKVAVKCFYEIVARLDTDATCTGGNPSGGTGDQVQIRFGFVPYSVNVNVGKLLPSSYFPDTWHYQTRTPNWTTSYVTNYPTAVDSTGPNGNNNGDWSGSNDYNGSGCPNDGTVNQTSTVDTDPSIDGNGNRVWYTRTYSRVEYDYTSGRHSGCTYKTRPTGSYTSVKHTAAPVQTPVQNFSNWTYGSNNSSLDNGINVDLRALKNGTGWAATPQLTLPIGSNGANRTITWNGCIEERQTVSGTDFTPIPNGAKDLDIDSAPGSDSSTMWKPALGDIEYSRKDNRGNYTTSSVTSSSNYTQPDNYCPTESRKLQPWPSASDFDNYVDSLTPVGNTYHDIGLLWGARFISPTGIFSTENAYTPKGGEIERHLIFMTDGDTQTATNNYAAYGYPWYDRRNVSADDVGSSPGGDMNAEVNARFLAICDAVKRKNITLWVISFGSGSNSTTEDRLDQCATDGRYFVARDAATLQTTFRSIADQISQLRLTK